MLAAFFCLLFFAAAKKSRCRPAQGQRVKHEDVTRTPAQRPECQTATLEARRQNADASTKANRGCQRKDQNTEQNRPRREGANPNTSAKPPQPNRPRSKNPKPNQKARPAGPPIARFRHCRYSLWHGTFQVPLPVSSSRQATTLASSSAPAALIVFALRLPRSLFSVVCGDGANTRIPFSNSN